MKQIAGAIEEGAKAYLGRQVRSIVVIATVIVVLVATMLAQYRVRWRRSAT